MKRTLSRLLFGSARFRESEEFQEFQYKFLLVVMLTGALFTGFFLLTVNWGLNPMSPEHVRSMTLFSSLALVLWGVLRGRKHWFVPVAWTYEAACLLEYTSALVFVPQDEMRMIWFHINVPGVYILLGQKVGLTITALTAIGLAVGNGYLSSPYSVHAMATGVVSLVYLAMFFHVYGDRVLSYFARMRASHEKLHDLATRDALTGVHNARAYQAICDQLLATAKRQQTTCSVLFVDLDHFKAINDQHGHLAGDLVLQAVAQCLSQQLRSTDALGRIGGEEFSICLNDTPLAEAQQVAEALRHAIEALMPDTGQGQRLRVTASIGVTSSPNGAESLQAIQQRADAAMYAAKQRGRNRVSVLEKPETAMAQLAVASNPGIAA